MKGHCFTGIDLSQCSRFRVTEEVTAKLKESAYHQIDRDGIVATRLCTHKTDVELTNENKLQQLPGLCCFLSMCQTGATSGGFDPGGNGKNRNDLLFESSPFWNCSCCQVVWSLLFLLQIEFDPLRLHSFKFFGANTVAKTTIHLVSLNYFSCFDTSKRFGCFTRNPVSCSYILE